jgi:4-hydroxybenzoyl-CoA reductase subunit beta
MLVDSGPATMLVAGGTDLYPKMKRRQMTPKTVIGLRQLASLKKVSLSADQTLILGANLSLSEAEQHPEIRSRYPALAQTIRLISTPPLRNMGTLGGNICLDTRCNYYDQNYEWRKAIHFCLKKDGETCWVAPSSKICLAVSSTDTVPLLIALKARFQLLSTEGERLVPADEFFQADGIHYLRKKPEELLVAIHLPPAQGFISTYKKLRRRGAFDFPVLGVAVSLKKAVYGTCEGLQVVIGGVASSPLILKEVGDYLEGKTLSEEQIRAASELAGKAIRPMNNTDFDPLWRKEVSQNYVYRALKELQETPS